MRLSALKKIVDGLISDQPEAIPDTAPALPLKFPGTPVCRHHPQEDRAGCPLLSPTHLLPWVAVRKATV